MDLYKKILKLVADKYTISETKIISKIDKNLAYEITGDINTIFNPYDNDFDDPGLNHLYIKTLE